MLGRPVNLCCKRKRLYIHEARQTLKLGVPTACHQPIAVHRAPLARSTWPHPDIMCAATLVPFEVQVAVVLLIYAQSAVFAWDRLLHQTFLTCVQVPYQVKSNIAN